MIIIQKIHDESEGKVFLNPREKIRILLISDKSKEVLGGIPDNIWILIFFTFYLNFIL